MHDLPCCWPVRWAPGNFGSIAIGGSYELVHGTHQALRLLERLACALTQRRLPHVLQPHAALGCGIREQVAVLRVKLGARDDLSGGGRWLVVTHVQLCRVGGLS